MKTLSEHTTDRRLEAAKDAAKKVELRQEFLQRLRAVPPLPVGDLGVITRWLRDFDENKVHPIGLACDRCGFELVGEPGFRLMSNPPKRWVACLSCGYLTTQSSLDA